jgi:hypothetical protein
VRWWSDLSLDSVPISAEELTGAAATLDTVEVQLAALFALLKEVRSNR